MSSNIVISSRVRIARNLKGYKFPQIEDINDSMEVTNRLLDRFKESDDNYNFYRIEDLTDLEKYSYVERHLISPVLSESRYKGSFLLRDDNVVTIMINEEDHLRMQVLLDGMNLDECWEIVNEIDDFIEEKIEYAYDRNYGFMTACPTNVGTGLRASVMLHLPAITITGKLEGIKEILQKFGLTIRGFYGEGSKAIGSFYQISNQRTLGDSEHEIIKKLNRVVNQIVIREKNIRALLRDDIPIEIEDAILRSLGILLFNKRIDYEESMRHISNVKLGMDLGIIEEYEQDNLLQLMNDIQPATLQVKLEEVLDGKARDIARSKMIRDRL